jgi:DNA-binding response OmpR family regulator
MPKSELKASDMCSAAPFLVRWGVVFGYVSNQKGACYRFGWYQEREGMAKLKVLYGESDEQVLAEHSASIEKAGHQVQSAVGRKGVLEALQSKFDLVILGATLTRDDRHHLPYMVKKTHKETPVLVLHTDGSRHPQVDEFLDTGSDMEHLLAKIRAMQPKAAAAAAGAR